MNQKSKLIDSMVNLIQHISSSRINQQQIFSTLSLTDVKKILSNMEDSNEKLRKTTLVLLAQLLYENAGLQKKFCQLTGMPDFTGKVVLTHNFPKSIINDHQSLLQITKALKDQLSPKDRGLFWYIDSHSKPKIIQIGKRNIINIDPLHCIVGVWIIDDKINDDTRTNNTVRTHQQSQVQYPNQKLENNNIYSNNNTSSYNGKVRLNKSQQIDKNQQYVFKPQTPMKVSFNQNNKNGVVPNRRAQTNNSFTQGTPTQVKSQIKNYDSKQLNRMMMLTAQRKSLQPNTTAFDTLRYIKPNNYVNGNSMPLQHQQIPLRIQIHKPVQNHSNNGLNVGYRPGTTVRQYINYPKVQFKKKQ